MGNQIDKLSKQRDLLAAEGKAAAAADIDAALKGRPASNWARVLQITHEINILSGALETLRAGIAGPEHEDADDSL